MGKAKKKRCATRLLCGRRWTVNEDAMLREAVGGFMIDDVSSAVTEKETEGSKRKRCSNSGSQRIDWKHISRVCMASKRSAPECQNRWEKVRSSTRVCTPLVTKIGVSILNVISPPCRF